MQHVPPESPSPILRVTFWQPGESKVLRDDGRTQRWVSVPYMHAEWLYLAQRGFIPYAQLPGGGQGDPRVARELRKMLSRPGRPPTSYKHEWVTSFEEIWARETDLYEGEKRAELDDAQRPTKLGVCWLVACADYLVHPERFNGDPSLERSDGLAARRVWAAVNRLSKR
jgi:hypothetical protein